MYEAMCLARPSGSDQCARFGREITEGQSDGVDRWSSGTRDGEAPDEIKEDRERTSRPMTTRRARRQWATSTTAVGIFVHTRDRCREILKVGVQAEPGTADFREIRLGCRDCRTWVEGRPSALVRDPERLNERRKLVSAPAAAK